MFPDFALVPLHGSQKSPTPNPRGGEVKGFKIFEWVLYLGVAECVMI